jgi:hypothetical protein
MNIQWTKTELDQAVQQEIETNIKAEFPMLEDFNEEDINQWTVYLTQDSLNQVLYGIAKDQDGQPRVKFTYSLDSGHFAHYESI